MAEPANTPPTDTKECPSCDAVIGKTEKTCPKCSVDLDELEDTLTTVEKANAILEKRRKKTLPLEPPPAPKKKTNKLRSLGSFLRGGK
jgi:hypothetical protein